MYVTSDPEGGLDGPSSAGTAPAESELLIKWFPYNLMAREALSSSFSEYNLHFPSHSPWTFLSRQDVWRSHHPQAQ